MSTDRTKDSAQEFFAEKLSRDFEAEEAKLNHEAAVRLCRVVWTRVATVIQNNCKQWNQVTGEETLTCKETLLGDLRIRCAGRPHQMLVHYESRKLLVTIKNTARPDTEPDTYLTVEGYPTGNGAAREARLVRNNEPANLEMLILGHLRVLAGLSQRAE
jgi:hypothetical protein